MIEFSLFFGQIILSNTRKNAGVKNAAEAIGPSSVLYLVLNLNELMASKRPVNVASVKRQSLNYNAYWNP